MAKRTGRYGNDEEKTSNRPDKKEYPTRFPRPDPEGDRKKWDDEKTRGTGPRWEKGDDE